MKYFLDSAKIEEIKEAYHTFGIDGVTTNPRHIMVSGKPFLTVISEMADWVKAEGIEGYEKFPISVEINPHLDDADEMVAEARKISAICSNFVIKILPAKNNSLFVSPFIGWKEANGEDCKAYIQAISDIYDNYGYKGKTQIICAAIRTPKQIVDCAVAGADIVTTGLAVYKDSIKHAYTRQGLETFQNAWDNTVTE